MAAVGERGMARRARLLAPALWAALLQMAAGSCQLNPDMIGPGSRFPGAVMRVYPDGDPRNNYCSCGLHGHAPCEIPGSNFCAVD